MGELKNGQLQRVTIYNGGGWSHYMIYIFGIFVTRSVQKTYILVQFTDIPLPPPWYDTVSSNWDDDYADGPDGP